MSFVKLPRPVHFCNCGDHAWTALTKGHVTLVSPQDAHILKDRAWTAILHPKRAVVYARSTYLRLHRVITQTKEPVDHINGWGTDNRRSNLRSVTVSQNAMNGRSHVDSTSKFRGVCRYRGKWLAQIYVKGQTRYLGYFDDEIKAARAYDAAASQHFGEHARLNF